MVEASKCVYFMPWLIGGRVPETGIAAKANGLATDYCGLAWVSSPRVECLVIVQKGFSPGYILRNHLPEDLWK